MTELCRAVPSCPRAPSPSSSPTSSARPAGGRPSPTRWPPPSPGTTSCSTRPSGPRRRPPRRAGRRRQHRRRLRPGLRRGARRARRPARACSPRRGPRASPLKVRMAVHTGEARLRDEGNYIGRPIIRTARLRAIAHGGQVLVSSATHDLVVDELPHAGRAGRPRHPSAEGPRPARARVAARPSGPRDGLPAAAVARRRPEQPAGPPVVLHRAVRRDRHGRPRSSSTTGSSPSWAPAEPARRAWRSRSVPSSSESFPDGVWWVDLVEVDDPTLLAVRDQPGGSVPRGPRRPSRRASPAGSAAKRALLIFDNCEHLVDASAEVGRAILRRLPRRLGPGHEPRPAERPRRAELARAAARAPSRSAGASLEVVARAATRFGCSSTARRKPASDFRLTRRQRRPTSSRSAPGWTASRWPSSWRPPGAGC